MRTTKEEMAAVAQGWLDRGVPPPPKFHNPDDVRRVAIGFVQKCFTDFIGIDNALQVSVIATAVSQGIVLGIMLAEEAQDKRELERMAALSL